MAVRAFSIAEDTMRNTEPAEKRDEKPFVCTESEKEVIRLLRSLDFGELTVTVKDGEPVRVELHRSIHIK